jgi:uncharacterized membrane protein (DUF373 family)
MVIKKNRSQSRFSIALLVPALLRLLIVVTLLGLFGGIIKTLLDLQLLFTNDLEIALRQLIINVLTLLAVVEVIKTALSYLVDGRVRVTFIVDTVLIVMLNEILTLWFKGIQFTELAALILIILTLIFIRILAIRFSPAGSEE